MYIFNMRLCNKLVYILWNLFTVASAQFFNFNTCASILKEDCYQYGSNPECGSNGVTYRNRSIIKYPINIYTYFILIVKQFMLHCVWEQTIFKKRVSERRSRIYFFQRGFVFQFSFVCQRGGGVRRSRPLSNFLQRKSVKFPGELMHLPCYCNKS